MTRHTRFSLRLQISLALLVLAVLFVVAMGVQVRGFEQAVADQALLGEIRSLQTRLDDLLRAGRGYAALAPRDYDSYERDVALTYRAWNEDLNALDGNFASINSSAIAVAGMALSEPLQAMRRTYREFRSGLSKKFGDEIDNPRLEWGAQFIEQHTPELIKQAASLQIAVSDVIEGHLQRARQVTRGAWMAGSLGLLAVALWFWFGVISRLSRVSKACTSVAEGAFGTRAPIETNDELGDLSQAFNQLSSRTRVVLGVLDRLPDGASAAQAFDLLWEESRDHLGHRWQALFDLGPAGTESPLLMHREESGVDFSTAGYRFALTGIAHQAGLGGQDSALLADVRRHTLDQTEGRLLRELSRRNLRTLALVRLRDPKTDRERVLAFAWSAVAAQETGVARFLGGLARFFGRALNQPQVQSLIAQRAGNL